VLLLLCHANETLVDLRLRNQLRATIAWSCPRQLAVGEQRLVKANRSVLCLASCSAHLFIIRLPRTVQYLELLWSS